MSILLWMVDYPLIPSSNVISSIIIQHGLIRLGNSHSTFIFYHSIAVIEYYKYLFFFKILFIYFREGKGGRKKGRETSMCGWLSCAPNWGPGPQPRHVPWLGVEPVTLWFAGQHSVHWATPARAIYISIYSLCFPYLCKLFQRRFVLYLCIHSPYPLRLMHSRYYIKLMAKL